MKAAVIGHPVAHSLSPLIHNDWFEKYGIEGRYEAIDISPENLKDGLSRLIAEGYVGFNLTIPHKQAVMKLCSFMDDTALAIGAVNTLTVRNGTSEGTNTDWSGFTQSILEKTPDFDFSKKPALVLGAGGAARAIVYGLKKAGAKETRIANRTDEKARALAAEFGAVFVPWAERERAAQDAGLLVNTTAAGMKGKPPLDFDIAGLPRTAIVCDIIYNPLQTPLLQAAQKRGNVAIDGLGMLIQQARPAFALWTGIMPEATKELRKKLEEALR